MKKILFDLTVCQPIKERKYHGGGVYGTIVLERLVKIHSLLSVYVDTTCFLDKSVQSMLEDYKVQVIDASRVSLIQCIQQDHYDVLYSPLYRDDYKEAICYVDKLVITIHGLRNLEMNRDSTEHFYYKDIKNQIKACVKQTPAYYFLKRRYRNERSWLFECDKVSIITVSNHSKNSILFYYPSFNEKKISVKYSPSTTVDNYNATLPYSNEKYYLIVSCERWIKNAYRSLLSLDILFSRDGFTGKAIVVGAIDKTRIMRRIKNVDRFLFLPYVDKQTLESLYKGAFALLYPSLNEGFGYPPLEAMKYGTPVVASSFSAINEVCADAVIYTNPYSVDEISIRLLELESKEFYNEYSSRAKIRYSVVEEKQHKDLEELASFIVE